MKKIAAIIMAAFMLVLMVGCSSSGSQDAAVETKKEKMADKAEGQFEVCDAFSGKFIISGYGNYKTLDAHLMYNDDNDSYKFSLRFQGNNDPAVTFYLAKAEIPDSDRYLYAYVVTSAQGYIFQQMKDTNRIMLAGDGFDRPITMSDIEDNFNMSESDSFTLKGTSDL